MLKNIKLLAAVCVYQRKKPIQKWLHAWNQSNTYDTPLIVFHNFGPVAPNMDSNPDAANIRKFGRWIPDVEQVQSILKYKPDFYVPRMNVGCDLGALHEFTLTHKEFPYFDALLWATDDAIPMKKTFVSKFYDRIRKPEVGLVGHCFQTGPNLNDHIRTNMFCIRREVLLNIDFTQGAKHLVSHSGCCQLEHGTNNLYRQVLNMGYKVESTLDVLDTSWMSNYDVMWDCDHCWNHYKWSEYEEEFGLDNIS